MLDLFEALDAKESFSNGNAEGGFIDNWKRAGGAKKTWKDALEGKKTKRVAAKDLKPGMITSIGEVKKVTNIGWVNGKPSVEVSYGGIGAQGSYAADVVATDKEYEVLDESIAEDIHDANESIYAQMDKIDDVESLDESVDDIVVDNEVVIPEPFDVYYTIANLDIDADELPDAFDHYKDLKVVAEVVAKDEYDEALSDNGIEFCWLVNDDGEMMLVTTVALRVYPITLEEIQNSVDKSSYDDDYDDEDR